MMQHHLLKMIRKKQNGMTKPITQKEKVQKHHLKKMKIKTPNGMMHHHPIKLALKRNMKKNKPKMVRYGSKIISEEFNIKITKGKATTTSSYGDEKKKTDDGVQT